MTEKKRWADKIGYIIVARQPPEKKEALNIQIIFKFATNTPAQLQIRLLHLSYHCTIDCFLLIFIHRPPQQLTVVSQQLPTKMVLFTA